MQRYINHKLDNKLVKMERFLCFSIANKSTQRNVQSITSIHKRWNFCAVRFSFQRSPPRSFLFIFFIFYFLFSFFFFFFFFLVPFYHITTYKSRLAFLFTVSSYHPFSDRTRRWRRQKRGKQSTAIHHTPSSQPGLWVIARNLRVYLIIRSQIRNILTAGGDVEIPLNGVSLITEASLRASFVDIIFKKDPRENPRWDESKFQKYYTPLNFVLNDDYLWSIFFLVPYWRKIHWFP